MAQQPNIHNTEYKSMFDTYQGRPTHLGPVWHAVQSPGADPHSSNVREK